ncbi:hypothetical protein D047_2292B, partial [Vibrio parahaemolyticus VPTS-2010_2]
PSIVFV